MSLNIKLPELLIADLYKDLLVNPHLNKNEGNNSASESDRLFRFLGSNLKRICILISQPLDAFLPETHLDFLIKMLGACRLNLEDVAIINHHTRPVAIAILKEQLLPKKIVLFDINPTSIGLPLNFPQFKLQEYDGCTYLHVPSFEEFSQPTGSGKLLKSKLWICLKELFEV